MRRQAIVLAAALVVAPLGARAADLVVWWEKGFYPQADEAVAEIVAAFEQETGKRVELVQPEQDEIMKEAETALQAGTPPDFLFSTVVERDAALWAYEDRLVDLASVLGAVLDLFDADTIEVSTLLDGKTGQRGLYALPMGRVSNHIHVWNSLLERADLSLADIPTEWEAFWSFWCDRVQPAVRKALGREDIWAVGLPMSVAATVGRRALTVPARIPGFLAEPGPAHPDRQSRGPGRNDQGHGGLHRDLAQGLHAARVRRAGPTPTTTRRSSPRRW